MKKLHTMLNLITITIMTGGDDMKKILSLLVISLFTCIYVQAQGRVALVIGNGNYKNSPLDNPVQDATEIAQKLRELNFPTILKTECIYRHKPATFKEANEMIDRYIHFYNHERIQLKTGVAPLTLRHSA